MFTFGEKMDKTKANNVSPVVLAFVGDAVYSLFIREKLVFERDCKPGELNRLAVESVRATAQAKFVQAILPFLTESEVAIYKRARNAKKGAKAKTASVAEYNMSTGFEAVIGYLYLTGDLDRMNYLLNLGENNEG